MDDKRRMIWHETSQCFNGMYTVPQSGGQLLVGSCVFIPIKNSNMKKKSDQQDIIKYIAH